MRKYLSTNSVEFLHFVAYLKIKLHRNKTNENRKLIGLFCVFLLTNLMLFLSYFVCSQILRFKFLHPPYNIMSIM